MIRDLFELRDRAAVFRDRVHAGEVLATLLAQHQETTGLVLAIPAGGVPVGSTLARRLALPFDACVVSKITPPWDTEVGFGAVAFDGTTQLNEPLVQALGLTDEEVARGVARTRAKVARRTARLRRGRPLGSLAGRTVVLVDDGLASGFTMRTALAAVRRLEAARTVVAVPTGHADALAAVARDADAVYCANVRRGPTFAVADAYEQWSDLSEEEIIEWLDRPM